MGRGKSYTIEDYANRVEMYLHTEGAADTQSVIKNVKGTDYRVVDGLFHLAMHKRVQAAVSKHTITWSMRGE